jgi:hypothetical protein
MILWFCWYGFNSDSNLMLTVDNKGSIAALADSMRHLPLLQGRPELSTNGSSDIADKVSLQWLSTRRFGSSGVKA